MKGGVRMEQEVREHSKYGGVHKKWKNDASKHLEITGTNWGGKLYLQLQAVPLFLRDLSA